MEPIISVVMTVYNTEKYVKEAIDSILNQTFDNFELIVVHDASTDNSLRVLESIRDLRLVLVNNEKNIGVAASSNVGLDMARGRYIIRMDSDDISLPNRFATQVRYMEDNEEIGVLGSWVRCFGENLDDTIWEFPLHHDEIRANQIFTPKIHHSSVIMRKSVIDRFRIRYNPAFVRSLDYELWVNHADKWQYANQAEILLLYRRHQAQISTGHYNEQQVLAGEVRLRELNCLGIEPNEQEYNLHQMLSMNACEGTSGFVEDTRLWLEKLRVGNEINGYYDKSAFEMVLANKWVDTCSAVTVKEAHLASEIWSKSLYLYSGYKKAQLPENEVKPEKLAQCIAGRLSNEVAIFGTGRAAIQLYINLRSRFSITAFIDNRTEAQGGTIFGIPIVSLDTFIEDSKHRGSTILTSILGDHDRQVMDKIRDITREMGMAVISWKELR